MRGWAASPAEGTTSPAQPGTINIIVALPVALTDAALVNAVATATEAKVQALLDAGYHCSGTPTDAVCVAARTPCPGQDPHAFAGPRSLWGARLARAVHSAVRAAATTGPRRTMSVAVPSMRTSLPSALVPSMRCRRGVVPGSYWAPRC